MNMKKEVIHFLFNAWPNVARMALQKLTDLGYETLPHPSYSLHLSPTNYHFLKHFSPWYGNWFRKSKTLNSNLLNST